MGERVRRWRLARRLRAVVADLNAARAALEVSEAQELAARDDDAEWGTRSIVSGRADDRREARAAHRQTEVMAQAVERARSDIARLERLRDALLAEYPASEP